MSAFPFEPSEATADERRKPHAKRATTVAFTRRLDVLVVDDDDCARDVLALAVRSFGHTSRVAADGDDALRAIAERRPDVVISDWEMPGMNGSELCRRTRSESEDAPYIYFILMTGFSDREHLLAGMAAGADDYQRKPVDLDELEARLASAARGVDLHARLAAALDAANSH